MRLSQLAIATAPVLFVLLWSTGFIGARYGLPYIEPLTFLAIRMAFVVLILSAIVWIGRTKAPNVREVQHALVAGSLVHGLYLGGVFTAISQGIPAGISALIPGLQPILISTIANRFMGETVTRSQWIGLALGLLGVVVVLHDRNIVLGIAARLGRKFPVTNRHYARYPLPEALLRRDRLARRQPRAIYRGRRAVCCRRFCI
jgi:drug/metabolite transporter (DMT)-like permease